MPVRPTRTDGRALALVQMSAFRAAGRTAVAGESAGNSERYQDNQEEPTSKNNEEAAHPVADAGLALGKYLAVTVLAEPLRGSDDWHTTNSQVDLRRGRLRACCGVIVNPDVPHLRRRLGDISCSLEPTKPRLEFDRLCRGDEA